MCISFLWAFQKFASRLMTVVKKNTSPFVWALQQCASRFYEGLKNVHLLFMSLSKMWITLYEGHKNSNLLSMSAATVRITVLWRPYKCASPFYESSQTLHHDLWRSWKKTNLLCMSAPKTCAGSCRTKLGFILSWVLLREKKRLSVYVLPYTFLCLRVDLDFS